jgi:hypothetical protein
MAAILLLVMLRMPHPQREVLVLSEPKEPALTPANVRLPSS